MKKVILIPAVIIFLGLFSSCSTTLSVEMESYLVENVDINRYAGLWYQVGRYPHFFQSGNCAESTAEYTIRGDGKIKVLNRCWKDYYGGKHSSQVTAVAKPVNEKANWLNVRFYGIFPADYLIIELDENYRWAAVTTPDQDTLWILSRTPALPSPLFESIVDSLVSKGFDRDKIIKTSAQK